MRIEYLANDRRISTIATQKEIEDYLLHHYCISRKLFREAVSAGRKARFCCTDIESCGRVVTIYLLPRKMWIASCPREAFTPSPAYSA